VRKEIVGVQQLAHNTLLSGHGPSEPVSIVTTLGELIEAINEEVEPEEDYLVSKAVTHLIAAGRIRFLNPKSTLEILWAS
jgi:transposase-like protein